MPWGEVLDSTLGSHIFDQALVPGPLLRQHLANVESSLPTNFTLLYPSSGTIFCIRLQVQSYNSGWWCFSGLCENDDDKNDDDNLSFITMLMPMIITAMSKWRRHTFCPNAQTFDCYANTNLDAEAGNNENIKYSVVTIAVSMSNLSESLWPYYSVLSTSIYFSKVQTYF